MEVTEKLKIKQEEIQDIRVKIFKTADELSKLNISIKQVEIFCKNCDSEINISKKITYKAEENLKKVEGDKGAQDMLIDTLNERIKSIQQDIQYLNSKLLAQEGENKEANEILRDAD